MLTEVVLVTYRNVGQGRLKVPDDAPLPLPLPSTYTSVVIFYGALSLVPGEGAHIAGMIGWGMVVATFLGLWQPSSASVLGTFGTTPTLKKPATPAQKGT